MPGLSLRGWIKRRSVQSAMLTPGERALLFRACWDHPVATCNRCGGSFRKGELAAELFARLSDLCPSCRVDLTDSIRAHLISCAAAAALAEARHVIAEARALLETNAMIRKDAQQTRDLARLVRAEAEAERQKREAGNLPPQT